MALARPVDAVSPVQAGVEPLRRIRRRHLHGQHEHELVEERARIRFGIEVTALPAPISPGPREALEHLFARMLAYAALLFRERGECLFVRGRAPEPGGNALF